MKPWIMALVVAGFGLVPSAVAAKQCRIFVYHGSNAALLTGRYQDVAKDNAVLSWGVRVTTSIGPAYADWSLAKNKNLSCTKIAGRYKCTAKARPCRK